jgi:ABC-type glycerol-3-phosphate transport system substrate-binding protein
VWAVIFVGTVLSVLPAAGSEYREESYARYLAEQGYAGRLAPGVVPVAAGDETSGAAEPLSWDFECEEPGFYHILIEYLPLPETGSTIERRLLLDGEFPYDSMKQLVFNRLYDNSGGGQAIPVKNGGEIRQKSVEVFEWTTVYLTDSQKRRIEPSIVYLSNGRHTLTLEPVKGAMLIRRLEFRSGEPVQPYNETALSGIHTYTGEPLTFQAERVTSGQVAGAGTLAVLKSALSIRNETDYTSVDTVPYHPWQTRLNVIGGQSWRAPGETISWDIEVSEAGLYGLSFRGAQSLNRGVTSFRRLYINGVTPCSEALALGFAFSDRYRQYDLSENGTLYYFNRGINRITLENVCGEFAGPLSTVQESLAVLNDLYRRTSQVTGLAPDKYLDYEISRKIPDFSTILADQSGILYAVVEDLVGITGEKNSKTALVETMAAQAVRLAAEPDRVVTELAAFKGNISALGDWVISISEMPLYVDSFTLYAPEQGYRPKASNFFVTAWNGILRFLATFFVDETKLGEDDTPRQALKVWVPTGRDQALIIKNMADDSFEPVFNIPVEVQLIPLDVVLPATLSGSGPDIVLDMPQANVLNFAMRNALTDLTGFDDYPAVASRFYQSALDAATYLDGSHGLPGIYGMPERQWFPMMYIRDDILAEMGIAPPETWEDFNKAVAALNIGNYDVYIPTGMPVFSSMVYQNGGNLYEGRGADYGISSGLYSEAAMAAFSDFTAFYTAYKVPVQADFANRFRTGEMPLGIYDYTLYNTLELFAPEIRGLWSFRPIPGVAGSGGGGRSINNTTVATTNYTAILDSCADKDAAWEFLKWWLSTEIQRDYALQLEAVLGAAGRYATANREVLVQLPWSPDAAEALLSQFERTTGVPEIPGGYMTTRMVDYAFRSVVTGTSAMRPRQALYMNLLAIDKELSKKRAEFHLRTLEADNE